MDKMDILLIYLFSPHKIFESILNDCYCKLTNYMDEIITMDRLLSIFFLLLFINTASATNLCDNSCELTLSFPEGGSIEATEPLTITFGVGGSLILGETGTINTAIQPVSTDYSAGGTLTLNIGESISFSVNGFISTATAGNMDYTKLSLTGPLTADITASGGTETISVNAISITGDATFNFDAINIELLDLSSDSSVTINGSETSNYFIIGSIDVQTLNVNGGSGSDVYDISGTNDTSTTGISGTDSTFNNSTIDSTLLVTNEAIFISSPTITISDPANGWSLNSVTTTELTGFNYDNPIYLQETVIPIDGLSWVVNGEICVLTKIDETIYCNTDNGKSYKLVNGEWVEIDSTGFINLTSLLLISFTILVFRRAHQGKLNSPNTKRGG